MLGSFHACESSRKTCSAYLLPSSCGERWWKSILLWSMLFCPNLGVSAKVLNFVLKFQARC
ncbi:Hypothetical predicted protein [Podarcis lilfordi]|uniref:Uncharacterized protein n=1 Tax=Podarcis lilfordi TaxID=74358 RepID=A0AA35JPQ5_9SAUR|nr:Hypothetical predicted protein [Podarcis lilfordi]